MSVTASFGSFSFLLDRDARETRFLPERLGAAFFALRLAIMAGIVLQPGKTASGIRCRVPEERGPLRRRALQGTRQARFLREMRIRQDGYFSASLRPASRLSKLRMVLSTIE